MKWLYNVRLIVLYAARGHSIKTITRQLLSSLLVSLSMIKLMKLAAGRKMQSNFFNYYIGVRWSHLDPITSRLGVKMTCRDQNLMRTLSAKFSCAASKASPHKLNAQGFPLCTSLADVILGTLFKLSSTANPSCILCMLLCKLTSTLAAPLHTAHPARRTNGTCLKFHFWLQQSWVK